MATNDFLSIADGGGARVLPQSAYLALTDYLANGWAAGIVPSTQMNKTLRQTSVMSYVLAQMISNMTGLDVLDNGAPGTILNNLLGAIRNTALQAFHGNPNGNIAGNAATISATPVAPSVVWDTANNIFWVCTTTGSTSTAVWYASTSSQGVLFCGTSTGTANAQVLTPAVPLPAYGAGGAIAFIAGFTNTGALTVNVSGLGARAVYKESPTGPIPLTGGEVVAGNLISARDDGTRYQLTATELGTAALANASSNTGVVAAVSGAITTGHLAVFSDTSGTIQDGGPAGVAAGASYINFNTTIGPGVYDVDTTAGPLTLTLIASPGNGASIFIKDVRGTWDTNFLTINPNGKTMSEPFGQVVGNLICDYRGEAFGLSYDGVSNWSLN